MSFSRKSSQKINTRLFGLFVGVEQYQDNIIGNLYCCEDDARGVYEVFKESYTEDRHQLNLLTNDKATRKAILACISQYMKEAEPNDLILLFVSTHGTINFNDYFFIPFDGNSNNILGTGISSTLLINGLATVARKDVKILLIIDTCHAGAITFDPSLYHGEFSCLFSSSPSELSFEQYGYENGLFSHFLIEGLKGAAKGDKNSRKRNVTLRNLYDYVYHNVQRKTNKRQNPLLIGSLSDDLVFI